MPTPLVIVALGLFLGMRHAADPDHVIAITTIVSRDGRVSCGDHRRALGMGHTVTILVVGSAIILLKLTIPPTLGLTMELSVALMLILLGVLNLTGLMRQAIGGLRSVGMVAARMRMSFWGG